MRSIVRPCGRVRRPTWLVEDGVMRSLKVALVAGAAIAAAFTSANAADLGPIMQAPRMIQPVQVEEQMGGWYLRGDIGVGAQRFKEFEHTQTNSAFVWPASWRIDQREMGDAAFIGGGIGFQWNSWLRFDATAEYRMKNSFKAIGSYTEFCPFGRCFDVYEANHSAAVLMANAYIDLGTWMCLTPFVGADADERGEAHPGAELDVGVGHQHPGRMVGLVDVEAAAERAELGVAADRLERVLHAVFGRGVEPQPGIPLEADAAADEGGVAHLALIDAPARRPDERLVGLGVVELLEVLCADADVAAQIPAAGHFLDLRRLNHARRLHDRTEVGRIGRREG